MNSYVATSNDIPSAFRLDKQTSDLTKTLLKKVEDDEGIEIDREVYIPEYKKTQDELLDDDFKLARDNLKELMDLNIEKVKEYSELVSGTDSPRAFEVFAKMIETSKDLNQSLIQLHQEKNKSKQETNIQTNIQNQQINMLSPMEAIRLLKENKNEQ